MRLLKRNLQTIWACQYLGKQPILNESGKKTGESRLIYSEPIAYEMNVSAACGTTRTELFGEALDYEKVAITEDMLCTITETSVLFVSKLPEFNSENDPIHDYFVKKVARSLNHISFAIKKVSVS